MPFDSSWKTDVREALRPNIGALAYVIIDETLDTLGIGAEEMNVRKIPPFLNTLKVHLPSEIDRETLAFEVGRILLNHVVRAAKYK